MAEGAAGRGELEGMAVRSAVIIEGLDPALVRQAMPAIRVTIEATLTDRPGDVAAD